MKARILSVEAGHSLGNMLREIPALQAQVEVLGLDLRDEALVETRTEFISKMQESIKSCNLLIIIDGSKDLYTREILSKGFQKPLVKNAKSAQNISNCFARAGREPNALGMAYAQIPEGAIPLLSPNTVEQGFLMVFPSLCVAVLPAGRRALEPLFADQFFPLMLKSIYKESCTVSVPIKEDRAEEVEEYSARIRRRAKNFLPAVSVGQAGPVLRLTAIRATEKESRACCDSFLEDLVSELGNVTLVSQIGMKGTKALESQNLSKTNSKTKRGFYDLPLELEEELEEDLEEENNNLNKNKNKNKLEDEFEEDEDLSSTARGRKKANKNKTKKQRGRMGAGRKILLTLLVCVFMGSLGYLAWYQAESMKNRSNYENLRQVYDNHGIIAPAGYPDSYDKAFSALWSINPDIVGWISIPDTGLDYPVVQTKDNEKYYRTNFEGTYSEHAVPFVDAAVNLKAPSANTLIYGHNIRTDGQMFNILKGYKEIDFLKAHPIINFNSVYNKGKYKIFSIFYSNTRPEHGKVFSYHEFINSKDSGGAQKYIDDVKLRSIYDIGIDVNATDELLTLSTCSYEFKDARYVVVARKIRPGEQESVDQSLIEKNPAPLYPDIWYNLFGGSAPATASAEIEIPFSFLNQQPILPENALDSKAGLNPAQPSPMALTAYDFSSKGSSANLLSLLELNGLPDAQSTATVIIKKPKEKKPASSSKKKIIKSKSNSNNKNLDKNLDKDLESNMPDDFLNNSDDVSKAMSVKINGKLQTGSPIDIVSAMVEAEMGASFQPEALKAQAVAAYTYVRFNNKAGISPGVVSKKPVSAPVRAAVSEVLGETVTYNGSYANTTYCASNAGSSNNSLDVWGGELPYLVSVESPGDKTLKAYGATKTFSEDEMASYIRAYCKIDPFAYSAPEDWFSEPRYVNGLYVGNISVCGKTISGRNVREGLMKFEINSAAFEVDYSGGDFTFTTYGYGHGVGMSQQGADYYAKQGWTYQQILSHYYPLTSLN